MTVALVMMARDEEAVIARACASALGLIDSWVLLDTGSTDRTAEAAQEALGDVPGVVQHATWENFGTGRTAALRAARDQADWLLMLDADQAVDFHPGLRDWLADQSHDPDVDVWNVEVTDGTSRWYRLPRLLRGGIDWEYVGAAHEYLDPQGRRQRSLNGTGLRIHDLPGGANKADKHERDIQLLAPAVEALDPRAIYYTAQALWCLGRNDEATAMYERRAAMEGTWEEERWHAGYMAAKIREDVDALVKVAQERPWRHEPLTAAAEIVRRRVHDDLLFIEN